MQAAGQRGFRAGLSCHGSHPAPCPGPGHVRQLQFCHQLFPAAVHVPGHGHIHLLLQCPVPAPVRNGPHQLLHAAQPAHRRHQPAHRRRHAGAPRRQLAHARRAPVAGPAGRHLGLSDLVGPRAPLHERCRGRHRAVRDGRYCQEYQRGCRQFFLWIQQQ